MSLSPEEKAVFTAELGAQVALATAFATRLGCTRDYLLGIVGEAWDVLARKRVAAAAEAGRTAETRRGPARQKGRRS